MNIKYVNSRGEELNLTEWPYMVQGETLFDYEWKYEATNTAINGGYVTSFYRDVTEIPLEVIIHATKNEDFVACLNKLHNHVEIDVRSRSPGRLVVNNTEYLLCYIVSSAKSMWSGGIRTSLEGLKLVSEKPFWSKDIYRHYRLVGTPFTEKGLDYPYDYAYDYGLGGYGQQVNNDYIGESDFKMVIYGPVTIPEVTIANHLYKVNIKLQGREYVAIDSRDKTITKYNKDGDASNVFNLRDKKNDIFQPIPAGISDLKTNARIDLTVYQERSEPKWIL